LGNRIFHRKKEAFTTNKENRVEIFFSSTIPLIFHLDSQDAKKKFFYFKILNRKFLFTNTKNLSIFLFFIYFYLFSNPFDYLEEFSFWFFPDFFFCLKKWSGFSEKTLVWPQFLENRFFNEKTTKILRKISGKYFPINTRKKETFFCMKISNFPTFHFFRKISDFPLTFSNFQSLHNSIDFSINFWLNLIFLNKIEENCFVENLLFTDENHSIIDVEEKKYNFYEIACAHDWNFERRFFVGRVEVGIWTIFREKLGILSGNS
jgi:hypothetical protein